VKRGNELFVVPGPLVLNEVEGQRGLPADGKKFVAERLKASSCLSNFFYYII